MDLSFPGALLWSVRVWLGCVSSLSLAVRGRKCYNFPWGDLIVFLVFLGVPEAAINTSTMRFKNRLETLEITVGQITVGVCSERRIP